MIELFIVFLVTSSVSFAFGAGFGSVITRARIAKQLRGDTVPLALAVARYRRPSS